MIENRRPVEHMNRRMLDGFLPTSSNVEMDGDRRIGEEKSDNPIRLRERIQHDLLIQWQSTKGLVNNPNSLRVNTCRTTDNNTNQPATVDDVNYNHPMSLILCHLLGAWNG